MYGWLCCFFVSSRMRHTRGALVTGVQTCALPIWPGPVIRACQFIRPQTMSAVTNPAVYCRCEAPAGRRLLCRPAMGFEAVAVRVDDEGGVIVRAVIRSEESRVGKEIVSTGRSWWSP